MQKILIYASNRNEVDQIRRTIESRLPFQVFTSFNKKSFEALLSSTNFHLMIFKKKIFEKSDFEFFLDLRMKGYAFPILALEQKITIDEEQVWQNPSLNINFLDEPFSEKALVGITKKLLLTKRLPKQRFKRFQTNQQANIETILEGDSHKSNMYNLSKGGAYCEFEGQPKFAVGDMLRLTISLDDVESQRVVNAKVIWTTRKGSLSGREGAGLKFISSHDAYKMLMDKL